MKLLIFSPFYPPHTGGLESHADEFNQYLAPHISKITVFTPNIPSDSPERELRYQNVEIIRFPAFEIIPNYPLPKFWKFKFWKLFFLLFYESFDIIISRTRFFSTSILALIYVKIKKVKWIHIEHGSDFVKLNSKFKSLVAKLYDYTIGIIILSQTDKIIANSRASADFCKKLKKRECSVIYRGVEIEKIEKILPAQEIRNKYKDNVIITFVGRLVDGKGIADLIKAFSQLSNNDNTICFIVGSGSQEKTLFALAEKLNIQNKVIFLGHKNFNETIGILKISDIFVNPSYTEGLPTSVIEAALCKKAIIATNVGGTPEIIQGNNDGYLIDPKNIKNLKEKLEVLIENKQLREFFGNNAYEEIRNKFDWKKSIEKYLSIFNQNIH